MKENIYKLLKFLNHNKIIVGGFVFVLFFVVVNSVYAGCSGIDPVCWINTGIGSIFISISIFFISFSSWVFGLLFPAFLNITGTFLNSGPINTAWILVRDLVNMFFIFFLLFTSIAKLVGKEKMLKQGNASRQIIYILLSAFLINFSKVICGVVVDITQIITLQFTNAFTSGLSNLGNLFKGPDSGNQTIIVGILFIVFALSFLAVAFTAILYILIRTVSLGIYAALSPLWFLWLSFPTKNKQIEQIKGETMDKFFTAAMGGPILAFYLWIALMLINPGDGSITDVAKQGGKGITSDQVTFNPDGTITSGASGADGSGNNFDSAMIMKMIVASAVMLFAQKQSMDMAKKAGTVMGKGLMDGVVNKVGAVGMKPLDGLKNMAQNTAKNVGNSINNTAGKIGDTAMGGIRNGIGMARSGNNIASKMLDRGLNMKEEMSANAINNAKMVSQRNSENKALQDAIKKGDPASIAKAREVISKRQIDQGKRVHADAMAAGGYGKYIGGGVKKTVGAVALTTAGVLTGGLAPVALAAGKFVYDANNSGKKAGEEKKRLQKQRQDMVAHPEKFTKDQIAHVDSKINEQQKIIDAEEARKDLAKKRSGLRDSKSQRKELDSLLGFVGTGKEKRPGTINDLQLNITAKELEQERLSRNKKEENDELRKTIMENREDKSGTVGEMKEREEAIRNYERQIKQNDNIVASGAAELEKMRTNKSKAEELTANLNNKDTAVTADDVAKQKGKQVAAVAAVFEAGKGIAVARDKSGNVITEQKKTDEQEKFDKARITAQGNVDYKKADGTIDPSKIKGINFRGNKGKVNDGNGFLAAMLEKLENGGELDDNESRMFRQKDNQENFQKIIAGLSKDDIAKFNKHASKTGLGEIVAKSSDTTGGIINDIDKDLEKYLVESGKYTSKFYQDLERDFGKTFADKQRTKFEGLKARLEKAKEEYKNTKNADGLVGLQEELSSREKIISASRGNKDVYSDDAYNEAERAEIKEGRGEKNKRNKKSDDTEIGSSASFLSQVGKISASALSDGEKTKQMLDAYSKQMKDLPKEFSAELKSEMQEILRTRTGNPTANFDDEAKSFKGDEYKQYLSEALSKLSESFVSKSIKDVELSHGTVRLLASVIAGNISKAGSGPSDMQNSVASTIDNSDKLTKSFQGFADNFSVLSGDFVSLAHELSSGIKEETQKTAALSTVMEKLISKEDNLVDASTALEKAIKSDPAIAADEKVYRAAFDSAKQNIKNKEGFGI